MPRNKQLVSFIYATATLAGTIIGVGLFALPYLTIRVGWPTMLLYFLVLGGMVTLIHVLFGELALHTPDHKRLPGFAERYWGPRGRKFTLWVHLGGLLGAVLAYVIVGGEFLHELLGLMGLNITLTAAAVFYLLAGAAVIYSGIKAAEGMQVTGLGGFFFFFSWFVVLGG